MVPLPDSIEIDVPKQFPTNIMISRLHEKDMVLLIESTFFYLNLPTVCIKERLY